MGISYDPSKAPTFDREAMMQAAQLGLTPISVICTDKDDSEYHGVQFDAYVAAVPRIGERIMLQDGTTCEVARVYHKVVRPPGSKVTSMFITVLAYRLSRGGSA